MEGAPVSLKEREPALPPPSELLPWQLVLPWYLPLAPLPSPLHCAGPVSMVTGLSDRRSSHRHGVLNSPTASPPTPTLHPPSPPLLLLLLLLSTEGSSKPPCLDAPSLFVRPRSASDRLLQIYSKADNKLERGYHLVSSRPEGQSIAGHAHTHTHTHTHTYLSLEYCECASRVWNSGAGYSPAKQRHVLSTSPWSLQRRDQLLANAVRVSTVTQRARRARTRQQNT